MKKRIVYLIGLLLPVLLTQSAFADVAADLSQAEGLYKAGQYATAEQAYLKVIQQADPNKPPEFEAALNARKKLSVVYIAMNQPSQAQAAVKELLAKHATYEWLPHALHEIIEQARDLNKAAQAGQVYRDILNAQPGHSQAVWLRMGIAITDVYLANSSAVDAGVKDIIARHSTDPWSAEALAQIGWAYDKLNQYTKARPLYEYVVDNWSDKPRTIYAHTALVRGCIRLRDKQAAQSRLDQLAKRYAADSRLPNVLNEIARGYREAQMYQEARPISRHILDTYPGHDQCIWAQRDIILCDIAERGQDAAQTGLQKLIKNYPSNGFLPYVLNEIAEGYRQGQMYQQAKSVSQYVLDNFPTSDHCLWAQRDIVLTDLASGNMDAATEGIQQLETRFAQQSGAIWAISEIAETCSKLGRHEQARDLFRFNLSNCPDRDDTIWSLRGFITESIALKDEANIDAAVKKLVSEYSASKNLPMAAVHVGEEFLKAGDARESDLFQYVIHKHPDHEQTILAKACMGQFHMQQGRDDQAEAIWQKILDEDGNHPRFCDAVCLMAVGYRDRAILTQPQDPNAVKELRMRRRLLRSQGNSDMSEQTRTCLQKAIAKAELVMTRFPEAGLVTAQACYVAGQCHQMSGDPKEALSYYERLVISWPDHERAWHAQFMIGRILEQFKRTKVLSDSEADPMIEAAYQRVVVMYPDCPAASAARLRLSDSKNRGERR